MPSSEAGLEILKLLRHFRNGASRGAILRWLPACCDMFLITTLCFYTVVMYQVLCLGPHVLFTALDNQYHWHPIGQMEKPRLREAM